MTHRDQLVEAWKKVHGDSKVLERSEVNRVAEEAGLKEPNQNFLSKLRVGRNQFSIANYGQALQIMPQAKWGDQYRKPKAIDAREVQHETAVKKVSEEVSFVPSPDPNYVKAGYFTELVRIINSGMFIPTFITGLSGMGKTKEVFEAAAKSKRELIRVNITIETDEDDLLGHYTLKDGETVWEDGPVIVAMERGAILLLD